LIGNKFTIEAKQIIKKRPGIKIMTYSDLIEKSKTRYQEYLKDLEDLNSFRISQNKSHFFLSTL
jgi:predicted MPP superfamily phosphohydrolase